MQPMGTDPETSDVMFAKCRFIAHFQFAHWGLSPNAVCPQMLSTSAPISARSVRCELTSVRTVIPSGNMIADAISPELPNPTPIGFAAKS